MAYERPEPPPPPYLVAGIGRAGEAATRALSTLVDASSIDVWDAADTPALADAVAQTRMLGTRVHLGGDGVALLARGPSVIRSPGIPIDAPLLAEARRRGLAVIDELELGWRLDRRPFVAVTGTNGKSTVAAMIATALTASGRRAAVAGNTQVGPPVSGLAEDAADVVVAEVSSFQLEACPEFVPDAAAFTNLSEDHLDRHRTMAVYEASKRRLFLRERGAVAAAAIDVDDAAGQRLAQDLTRAGARVIAAGRAAAADYRRVSAPDGPLVVRGPHGDIELRQQLPGEHNAANATTALALAAAVSLDEHVAARAIAGAQPPPGRFESVCEGQAFLAVVDFAHNPAGVRAALEAARGLLRGGRLLAVVGAIELVTTLDQLRAMGRAAAELADELIVTSDPLRAEESLVASGLVEGAGRCGVIPDRREAIAEAVRRARPGDVVISLGRGMRADLMDGGRFDDRDVMRRAIADHARTSGRSALYAGRARKQT